MSGYIGTKSVTLSTTSANVGGDSTVGGDLTVDTNTLYVDSTNNRVGVGTVSPDQTLHVHKGSAGTVASTASSVLTLENSTTAVLQFLSPNTASNQIRFGDPQDNGAGYIDYSHSSSALTFGANGPERMRIDSSGNVGIGTSSPATPLDVTKAGGGNYVATFQNTTSATPYGVIIRNAASGANGYPLLQVTNSAGSETHFRVDSGTGNVFVGTTSTSPNPGVVLQPAGNVGIGNSNGNSGNSFIEFRRNATQIGGVTQSGTTGVSYNTSSDHRLKENVTGVTDGITRVKQLEPKRFNFIADPDTTVDGFLAHEAQTVVPEAITGTHNQVDDDGNPVYQGIDQSKLVPLLTAALKESIAKIEALEARVTALEGN